VRILGHGIDAVETARVEHLLERHGQRFLDRVFTPGEQSHSAGSRRRAEHLAGRFAAKEACLKALGTGLAQGLAWTEIEVSVLSSGQPTLRLHGRAADLARTLGVREWALSITHTRTIAVASALASGE
jgi:holo-[acyl-carrier protein] synthase